MEKKMRGIPWWCGSGVYWAVLWEKDSRWVVID